MNWRVWRLSTWWALLWASAAVAAAWLLLRYPEAAANGVRRGLAIASQVLIPGLFPFLVLGGWLTASGLCDRLGGWLSRPLAVLGFPPAAASVWLIGLVGGYPAGAAAMAPLVKDGRLTESQARRLLCGCVNAGPGFCVATVGAGMLGSVRAGWLLWAAHAVAGTVTLLVLRGQREKVTPPVLSPLRLGQPLVAAAQTAARSLLGMTAFVALGSLLLSLLTAAEVDPFLRRAAACLIEVTGGCMEVLRSPFLLGFTLGFGGLSVHGQIASLLPFSLDSRFFLSRLLQGMLGGLLTLWWLPPSVVQTFTTPSGMQAELFASASALGGVSLLTLCVTWLISMRKKVDF